MTYNIPPSLIAGVSGIDVTWPKWITPSTSNAWSGSLTPIPSFPSIILTTSLLFIINLTWLFNVSSLTSTLVSLSIILFNDTFEPIVIVSLSLVNVILLSVFNFLNLKSLPLLSLNIPSPLAPTLLAVLTSPVSTDDIVIAEAFWLKLILFPADILLNCKSLPIFCLNNPSPLVPKLLAVFTSPVSVDVIVIESVSLDNEILFPAINFLNFNSLLIFSLNIPTPFIPELSAVISAEFIVISFPLVLKLILLPALILSVKVFHTKFPFELVDNNLPALL